MWWLPLVTAAKGAMDAKAAGDKQQRYNQGQAEVTRYSPLTGQTGQLDNSATPSMLSGGIAGGVQGLGIQQQLQNGMAKEALEAPDLSQAGGGVNMQTGGNALGGQNMSQQMGQQFGQYPDYNQMSLQPKQTFFASK